MNELEHIILGFIFSWLILLLPIFLLFLFSYLFVKKTFKMHLNIFFETIIYLIMIVFTFVFAINLVNEIETFDNMNKLSKYDSVINYLEDYKAKHGEYPKTLDFSKLKKDGYEYESYEVLNNNKDYIIQVSNYEGIESYNYCSNPSNPDYEQCRPQIKYPMEYTAFGKWIYAQNHD